MKINFVSGSYEDRSPNFDAEVCQNLFVQVDKEQGKSILSLIKIPGLKEYIAIEQYYGNLRMSGWLSQSWTPAAHGWNVYVLFASGSNPTIVGAFFNGTTIEYIGRYVSPITGSLNGMDLYNNNLVTVYGHGSSAVMRYVNTTPTSYSLPFIADYSLFNAYDFPTAYGAQVLVDSTNDIIYVANNTGRIVKLSGLSARLLRAFQGSLTTALDGSVLYYNYVYENYAWLYPRPASGGGGYWADTVDDLYDHPHLTTWGVGTIRTSHSTSVSFDLYGGDLYLSQYDSPYSRLTRYDGDDLDYVVRKSDTDYGHNPVGYDSMIFTVHGLYTTTTIRAYNSSTLAFLRQNTTYSGRWGHIAMVGNYLMLSTQDYTTPVGRFYKINPSTLAVVSVITPVRAGGFIKPIDDTFCLLCSNNYIDVYNVTTMTLVDALNIRDHGVLAAYNATAAAILEV